MTVQEFKKKWKLTYDQLAYILGSISERGLNIPATVTVQAWGCNKYPHPPGISTLLDFIDKEWYAKIKYWKHFQDMAHPVISRLDYPRDVLFQELILPNYQLGKIDIQ